MFNEKRKNFHFNFRFLQNDKCHQLEMRKAKFLFRLNNRKNNSYSRDIREQFSQCSLPCERPKKK